jgi:hypothetical protein
MSQPWQELVLQTEAYHKLQQEKFGSGISGTKAGWSIRDTAKQLGKSVGWVCETLQLAKELKTKPKLLSLEDRQSALNFLKPNKPFLPNETKVIVQVDSYIVLGRIVGRGYRNSKEIYIIDLEQAAYANNARFTSIVAYPDQVREK